MLALLCAWLGRAALGAAPAAADELWALRALARPAVPGESEQNPIDAFIKAKLVEKNLSPSLEADRRTLIRRLHFDLIGLPPTPARMEAFVADKDPEAYAKLVDELLASPHYGERWARHWLDLVHYADTHGYDKDQPRPNAWRYRDYVIRALNDDKPYGQFVEEQLAGDQLHSESPGAIEALGFIAAGPWDLIGHKELSEEKMDGKIARHLDRDDMVMTTMSVFTSMTVHCAQCHNHKFDPIPAADYYNLQSVFAALDRADKEFYDDPKLSKRREELKLEISAKRIERSKVEEQIAAASGEELREARKKVEEARKSAKRPVEYGYHSEIASSVTSEKWVQVDLGREGEIHKVILAPASDDFNGIGDGFGFPPRYRVEVSSDPTFTNRTLIADRTREPGATPGVAPQEFSFPSTRGRYVRITATELAPRSNDYIFALAELMVLDGEGSNIALQKDVTSLDSIEAPPRWSRRNLVDGKKPGASNAEALAHAERLHDQVYERLVSSELRAEFSESSRALAEAQRELAAMPEPKRVFAGTIHHGDGAFRGTGPAAGKPRAISVLSRGDIKRPGKPATPGSLSCVSALKADFEIDENAPEAERRAALAKWITHKDNPLTWRSIVNRVWQYHFGAGLVGTPNDFGMMGTPPTHPELLDWLAVEFREGGQSLKQLHKLIVTSATYKQTSHASAAQREAARFDGENTLLWRMNPRKLEAEAIRDSALFISGALDTTMFGPGFQDFVIEKPEHSPHYQYHLHDPDDSKSHRRSIYRFTVRSQREPFMSALDCADPSLLVEKRNQSISPPQALALLNNGFMVVAARKFAEALTAEAPTVERQLEIGFARALGRSPTETELRDLSLFAKEHGLPNACRVILNLNEFMFVD